MIHGYFFISCFFLTHIPINIRLLDTHTCIFGLCTCINTYICYIHIFGSLYTYICICINTYICYLTFGMPSSSILRCLATSIPILYVYVDVYIYTYTISYKYWTMLHIYIQIHIYAV
jgi:hypothetical protein